MPGAQTVWQLRTCARPSMVTRHSKQIPMPHSGPRGSPVTERRQADAPARATAVDTIDPADTATGIPLTVR